MLLGPNGSGKSTLDQAGMGLHLAERRTRDLGRPADRQPSPRHGVPEAGDAAANCRSQRRFRASAGGSRTADAATIAELLERRLGSQQLARPPRASVVGRRAATARARPRAGPRARGAVPRRADRSLDPAATKGVEDIIADRRASGVKIVMATHDLGQARRLAGDIVFLAGGRLSSGGVAAIFTPSATPSRRFLRGDLVI